MYRPKHRADHRHRWHREAVFLAASSDSPLAEWEFCGLCRQFRNYKQHPFCLGPHRQLLRIKLRKELHRNG